MKTLLFCASSHLLLLPLIWHLAPTSADAPYRPLAAGEGAIMRALRDTRPNTDLLDRIRGTGWLPGSTRHHCTWNGVKCDSQGHVVSM